jgi:hypothetical protein
MLVLSMRGRPGKAAIGDGIKIVSKGVSKNSQ